MECEFVRRKLVSIRMFISWTQSMLVSSLASVKSSAVWCQAIFLSSEKTTNAFMSKRKALQSPTVLHSQDEAGRPSCHFATLLQCFRRQETRSLHVRYLPRPGGRLDSNIN